VTDRFQDGRRGHVGNSSECYKMSNYRPNLMKIGIQTKKSILSSKITKTDTLVKFQDGRRRHFVNCSDCLKMGSYHPILMKSDTQTKQNMRS
jgi:hypothetical protein